jgi:membrane protein implicated in regulation of membrane protease activity
VRVWLASVADGAAVLVFAAVGSFSHSHAEDVTPLGVLEVAWPFLVGGAVGTVAGRTWLRPESLPSGTAVWGGTLVGGMLLRALTGGSVQTSFVIVAAIVLATLLLGWRATYRVLKSRCPSSRARRAPHRAEPTRF